MDGKFYWLAYLQKIDSGVRLIHTASEELEINYILPNIYIKPGAKARLIMVSFTSYKNYSASFLGFKGTSGEKNRTIGLRSLIQFTRLISHLNQEF